MSLQTILRAARVAELQTSANDLAALVRPPAAVALSGDSRTDRRRLLLLLSHERRRNKRLVAELVK